MLMDAAIDAFVLYIRTERRLSPRTVRAYADTLASIAPDWVFLLCLGMAIVGGILGAFIANKLISKHFEKAGII